jgi:small subunit ribosomal protein S6
MQWSINQKVITQMSHYETVFILNPVLSAEQVRETVDKFRGIIEANGGKVVHSENWGLRKLAYPIEKKKSGFYELLQFEMDGEHINGLEVNLKRDERIMRFLTVALDKYALAYAESRRNKAKSNA